MAHECKQIAEEDTMVGLFVIHFVLAVLFFVAKKENAFPLFLVEIQKKEVSIMIDTKNFQPLNVEETGNKKHGGRKGVLSLICSKNGNRLMISKELAETLGLTDTVKIGFIGENLVLGKHLPGDSNEFSLKKQGKKLIVYSAEVVHTVAEKQQLEFTNKVAFTWYKLTIDEYDGVAVALFNPEVHDDEE